MAPDTNKGVRCFRMFPGTKTGETVYEVETAYGRAHISEDINEHKVEILESSKFGPTLVRVL